MRVRVKKSSKRTYMEERNKEIRERSREIEMWKEIEITRNFNSRLSAFPSCKNPFKI